MPINLETITQWATTLPTTDLRSAALARLQAIGWPRARNEAWSFFPLSLFTSLEAQAPHFTRTANAFSGNHELFSLDTETDIAALLPLVLSNDTQEFWITDGATPRDDLALALHEPFSHTVLHIGNTSKARIILPRAQDSHSFKAQRLDIVCGEGSELELISTGEASGALKLGLRHVNIIQEAGSKLRILALHSGTDAYRASVRITLNGKGASCEYRALSLLSGNAQSHRVVRITHGAPECTSKQFIRQVLNGNSNASYDGSVIVERSCPGTVSEQLINSLLLSPGAKASTKPILKIYHDEVECTHGSTCSDLDSESMFYLESRGIPASQARRMLTAAFAEEVALAHPESPARTTFIHRLQQELSTLLSL